MLRSSPYPWKMHFDWKIFLTALGLAFILEGLPYFLAAEKMPEVLRALWSDIAPTRKAVEEEQLKWQP